MQGYWGMPETARVLRPDGWLRTGDLVIEDPDGTYTFVGRQKEVIRRRGENLSPAEVEEASRPTLPSPKWRSSECPPTCPRRRSRPSSSSAPTPRPPTSTPGPPNA